LVNRLVPLREMFCVLFFESALTGVQARKVVSGKVVLWNGSVDAA
jgi:hypothetical protein